MTHSRLVLFAALGMVLLGGVGQAEDPPPASASAPASAPAGDSEPAEELVPVAPPPGGTLARIRTEGVLRWGADPNGGAPYAFNDPADPDRIVGFEVELMDRLSRHLGVRPELVITDWDSLIPALAAGRTDLALNGLEVNDERAQVIRFSVPYFRYAQQLTVRVADQQKFRTLEDLAGRRIAVLNGSASVEVLKAAGWTDDLIVPFDDSLKPFDALQAGRVDAALGDSIIAVYYAGSNPALHNVPATFSPGVYAAAIRQPDGDLLAEVNRVLEQMKASGELGELYQRWDLWDDSLADIGVAKGAPQQVSPLAHPTLTWNLETLANVGWALLKGAGMTLLLTVISMPLALVAGLGLALMAKAHHRLLRWPALAYIQVMRGTPLLVQMYVIFFSLPKLGAWLGTDALTWPAFAVGVLCLAANYAAYEAEIHRAGIEAVPRGQTEAALAIGLSPRQAFTLIVLPQSFRIILPPVMNDLISMLKDSCLVSIMGVSELLFVAGSIGKSTFLYGQMLLAAAVIYLVLSLVADALGKRLEARLRRRGTPTVAVHGPRH